MVLEQKLQIAKAADAYITEQGLSHKDAADKAGINPAYLSQMLRGQTTTQTGDKTVNIANKWFAKLAEFAGVKVEKVYWETLPTPQFLTVLSELAEAKKTGSSRTLIGKTGFGKSYILDRFVNQHRLYTYRITVSAMHTLSDIINELLSVMSLPEIGSKASKMKRIIEFLRDTKRNGGFPIIIMDEAENVKTPVFGLCKGLYDGLKNYCSMVLIGTPELITKMERLKKREKDGMPQFYRRFKAGIRHIPDIDRTFKQFFDKYDLEKGLRRLLADMCENYGELNDYLEPALREADRLGEPLTEDLFRTINNLPNF